MKRTYGTKSNELKFFDLLQRLRLKKGYVLHDSFNSATGKSSLRKMDGWFK